MQRPIDASNDVRVPLPAGMRDLLPDEARSRRRLGRRLLDCFALHGYELVTPPAFELANVLERGLGTLDPRDVLRFVEPESGEVAALRPDVTPQIARMAATRLSERPTPMRLCYEGTVLRRRQERARRHRQIPQAGVELIGSPGPRGDLELFRLVADAVRAAGLSNFLLDVGHAEIARSLVAGLDDDVAAAVLEALGRKDSAAVADTLRRAGVARPLARALEALPTLHGDGAVWGEASSVLRDTAAGAALAALRELWDAANASGLASVLRIDVGEVRGFAYYTGAIFHVLAAGPGEPIASGGRYDALLERFGRPASAAGFAVDLDNLSWALRAAGVAEAREPRVVVAGGASAEAIAAELRARAIPCVVVDDAGAASHARAWGFSHWVTSGPSFELVSVQTGASRSIGSCEARVVAHRVGEWLASPEGESKFAAGLAAREN